MKAESKYEYKNNIKNYLHISAEFCIFASIIKKKQIYGNKNYDYQELQE